METVRKYGRNLGQGRSGGDIMAEKIQRSHCSCIRELCFFLKHIELRFLSTFRTEILVAEALCVNQPNISSNESPLMRAAAYP